MSKSDKESLTQDLKESSKEQAEESNNMKKDSEDKEGDSKERKKKTKEPQLPVSESSRSIAFHSSRGFSLSDDVPPAAVASQLAQVEADKVEEGMVDGGNSGYLMSKKEVKLNMALLGLRITAFVFCLISFSVLADDTGKGVFRLSFYHFRELKYSLSVNVMGFVYSGLQICDLVKYLITKKHTVNPRLLRCFSFAMDQMLTYLLLSASTSAATVARLLQASFIYADNFVEMAITSVALSFFAFKAFALATLVSGYILCRFN